MTKTELEIANYKIDRKEIKIDLCIANNKDFFIKSNFDKKNFRKIALRYLSEDFGYTLLLNEMFEHKATCERWLEYLEEESKRVDKFLTLFYNKFNKFIPENLDEKEYSPKDVEEMEIDKKIKDLKQTIARYVEEGI